MSQDRPSSSGTDDGSRSGGKQRKPAVSSARKLFVSQVQSATMDPGGGWRLKGGATFNMIWIQGMVVSSEGCVFALDDGTGVLQLDASHFASAHAEMGNRAAWSGTSTGQYLMVVAELQQAGHGAKVGSVQNVFDLSGSAGTREPLWMVEVVQGWRRWATAGDDMIIDISD